MDRGGTITKIEVQKHRPKRRSIFINGDFRFGLDEEIVVKNDLRVGQELDEDQIKTFLLGDKEKKAKEYVLNLLSYRDRSCREIKDRLKEKGYSPDVSDRVVESLARTHLLDDERFASEWGRERLKSRPMGARLLSQELRRKGIEPEIIEKTIDNLYGEVSEEELAFKLLESRRSRYEDLQSETSLRKMSDFLLRRGFPWEIVRETIESITTE